MKGVPIDKLPERNNRKGRRGKLYKLLTDFMESPHRFLKIEVEENEYKDPRYAYSSLADAVERYHYPINVVQIDLVVYLEKY